jgi:hypothetical protein
MKSKLQFTNPILALHKLIFLILPLAVALLTVICRFLRLCHQPCPAISAQSI